MTVSKVGTVALAAYAVLSAAAEYGTDFNALSAAADDDIGFVAAHHNVLGNESVTVLVTEVVDEISAD